MILNYKQILSFLILVISVLSIEQWTTLPISNTTIKWAVYLVCIIALLKAAKAFNSVKLINKDFRYLKWFIVWILICFVRGLFAAEYYWDYKSLLNNSFGLFTCLALFTFINPNIDSFILKKWVKYGPILFLLLVPFLSTGSYGFFLVPLSFLTLFFPVLNKKVRFIVVFAAVFVIVSNIDARSNVIKFLIPFLFSILYYFPKISKTILFRRLILIISISLPLIFISLGLTGVFNVFKFDDYIKTDYKSTQIVDGEAREISLKADTRTFLYLEVINSALKNDYVLFGRTPARGNDSNAFGTHAAEELKTGRYERYSNEVSILNIFTWTGIVGVVLYFLIFLKAIQLALFQSKSIFLKIVGTYVAFRWMYAWVEDFNRFDIMNLMLWMCIAICYSPLFREMNNLQFEKWVNKIFPKQTKRV